MKTLQLPTFTPSPGPSRPPSDSPSNGHGDEFRHLVRNEDKVVHHDSRQHPRAPGHSTSANDVEARDSDTAAPDSDDEESASPDRTDITQFPAITALIMESRESYRQWSRTAGNSDAESRGRGIGQSRQTHGISHAAEGSDEAGLSVGDHSVTAHRRKTNPANAVNAAAARESAQSLPADGSDASSSSNPSASEQGRGPVGAQQLSAQTNMRRASDAGRPANAAAANQAFLENIGGTEIDASSVEARRKLTLSDFGRDDGIAGVPAEGRSGATGKGGRSDNARGDAALSTEITLATAKYGMKAAEKNAAQTEAVAVILPRAELMATERHASTLTPAGTLASAIGSEPSWRPAAVAAMSQTLSHVAHGGPATLQVQLTPHHLGVVTARLILSGGQLEVEIEASSVAAHEHLKGEEHVIEKAIRNLGYDVGHVRITQSIVVSVTSKDDSALPDSTSPTRDQTSDNAMSSGSEGRSSGHHGGRDEGDRSGGIVERAPPRDADRSRRGVYI